MLGGSSEGPAMSECGLGKVCGTYGWVRYGVRYGGMVRRVGYGVRYGTAQWYGMMVQWYSASHPPYLSTVPLQCTQKFVVKSAKLVVASAKLVVKLRKLVVKTFKILVRLLGTVYPCAVPPYRSTDCTVPFFPLYRTSVHIVPYQCAQCTMPACVLYLCSLLYTPSSVRREKSLCFLVQNVPGLHFDCKFTCHSRRPRRNRCVFSCKMHPGFISIVNLHVTPANREEIVVFSHVKCGWASSRL